MIDTLLSVRRMLLMPLGVVGLSSLAHGTPLTVPPSSVFLQFINTSPSIIFGAGGEAIRYGANNVVPNGNAATNGVGVATTGIATTINTATGATLVHSIPFFPGIVDPDNFQGAFFICTTTCTPSGNNNPSNLRDPWTITFQNAATTPPNIQNTLFLQGLEIPFVSSVTLSGTVTDPTFSWSPPIGVPINGYRINITQNNLVNNPPPNSGLILTTPLSASATSYTVQGVQLTPDTNYTLAIVALQTRDNSSNLSANNVNAVSFAYSSFQTVPAGTPPVILPMVTATPPNTVVYSFNFSVDQSITYYIDPTVATGYIYKTGSGNPNFASVGLPDIGNPNPYDLYLWNGSAFVFDTMLAADTLFDFAAGGVSEFEVLGIDPSLGLDPNNTTAFITALTFEGSGSFTGTMTPITTNVPEPGSLMLLVSSLLGFGLIRHSWSPQDEGQRRHPIHQADARFVRRVCSDRALLERRQGGVRFELRRSRDWRASPWRPRCRRR